MAEDWTSYFSSSADEPVSTFVNLGLAREAPIAGLVYVASVRLRMVNPRPDGLSNGDEAEALWRIEDSLVSKVETSHPPGVFGGRTTSRGYREFFFFVPSPEELRSRIESAMRGFPNYSYEVDVREDRDWQAYFGSLLPNDEERKTIENRKVCEQLELKGDPLTRPREIDHWIYFPLSEQREEFQRRVGEMGFLVRALVEPSDRSEPYGIRIYRIDLPAYNEIDQVTLPLYRLARECGGEYDGWETLVETGGKR